jgi:RNA binding exosome subunit
LYVPKHPNANTEGYYAEHRIVVEQKLKRTLNSKEIVHHINGIRDDNRLSNLQLTSISKHVSSHVKGKNNPNYKHGKRMKL